MVVQHNLTAMNSNRMLGLTTSSQAKATEKLASGYKINRAADDAAGLAISEKMRRQIRGLTQASANAQDGISCVQTAEGALNEVHDMLQRINELCVKASTGAITDGDREMINDEVKQLKEEITRISSETEFNGQKILDGSFDLKGYTDNENVKVNYYDDQMISGTYEATVNATFKADGTIDTVTVTGNGGFPADAEIAKVDGNVVTVKGSDNFELKLSLVGSNPIAGMVEISLEGFGSMDMQIGANEGQQLGIRIPKISLENIGISSIDLGTADGASEALGKMNDAVVFISSVRSGLGAYQNRLEHTISSLDITNENMTAAYSRIMDADMAEEMTEYTTLQVLAQASTSMLAQANERPSQVLQLLQ